MLIFVIDSRNKPLYPTIKEKWANAMVKKGKAKWIRRKFIILKLNYPVNEQPRDQESYFSIGIDTGYKNIGYCVYKITGTKVQKLFFGEAVLRTPEIKKLVYKRKIYRQNRRQARRHRACNTKFRHPRWQNRLNKLVLTPSVRHLIQSHKNVLRFICKVIPCNKIKINLEYASFDTQKISQTYNPSGAGYGNQKAYILARDNHTCRNCGAVSSVTNFVLLHVHHKIPRGKGGTNRADNLITLCLKCHAAHHAGSINCNGKLAGQLKATGVLNTAMPSIYTLYSTFIPTTICYGYETKATAEKFNIEKSHANDAMILGLSGLILLTNYKDFKIEINLYQFRRQNRARVQRYEDRKYYLEDNFSLYKNGNTNYGKAVARNRNRKTNQDEKHLSLSEYLKIYPNAKLRAFPGEIVYKCDYDKVLFSPGDIVQDIYTKEVFAITAWASTQGKVIAIDGEYINISKVKKIKCNTGLVIL